MPTLKEAAQKRRATGNSRSKSKAAKFTEPSAIAVAQPTGIATPSPTLAVGTTAVASTSNSTSTAVPGLVSITPDAISGMMPQFDHNAYQVTDPLKPSDSIPQLTEAEFNRNETIYQGGIRALRSVGLAYDLTKERFTTEGKKAKAWGAGIQMTTEFEKVKGNYIDHLIQIQTNSQKSSSLDTAQHKTTVDAAIAVHNKDELTQKQELARIKAEIARGQVTDAQNKLTEFQKSLGITASTPTR